MISELDKKKAEKREVVPEDNKNFDSDDKPTVIITTVTINRS